MLRFSGSVVNNCGKLRKRIPGESMDFTPSTSCWSVSFFGVTSVDKERIGRHDHMVVILTYLKDSLYAALVACVRKGLRHESLARLSLRMLASLSRSAKSRCFPSMPWRHVTGEARTMGGVESSGIAAGGYHSVILEVRIFLLRSGSPRTAKARMSEAQPMKEVTGPGAAELPSQRGVPD